MVPVVDFADPNAKKLIVEACKDFGFFKVINHGVSMELFTMLENEAVNFFKLPQQIKEKLGPPNPFGYGNMKIGPNGDMGCLEYLLFCTNSQTLFPGISETFRYHMDEYVLAMKTITCKVLEMISDELKIEPDVISGLIRDELNDSVFRVNHYQACPRLSDRNVIGFGEHTDPQIISVLRATSTPGLQICLKNGTWVSVPPDQSSFYFIVGDTLQVMTNGRFRSVKHRVEVDAFKSRLSLIFFGGPPLYQKITPLSSLMEEGEESKYREFTWSEYKNSAYNTRLGDNRLGLFEKSGENSMVSGPK